MAKQSELKPLIIQEWLSWQGEGSTSQRLMSFYRYLEKEKPHLLSFRCAGDKWQTFKLMLKGHLPD
jgi:hypothetical protein